jgi:Mg2+ and Co2+ transporter CorA
MPLTYRKNEGERLPLLFNDNNSFGSYTEPVTRTTTTTTTTNTASIKNTIKENVALELAPDRFHGVEDLLREIKDHYSSRSCCMVIGLDRRCRIYQNLMTCWNDLATRMRRRRRRCEETQLEHEPIWIDVQAPSHTDIKMMEKIFGLHPLTIEDITTRELHEKWETFDDYFYAVFGAPVDENISTRNAPVNIIVFKSFVLTVHLTPVRGIDMVLQRIGHEFEIDDALNQINATVSRENTPQDPYHSLPSSINPNHNPLRPKLTSSPFRYKYSRPDFLDRILDQASSSKRSKKTPIPSSDWVFYALLDAITDLYIPVVESLTYQVEVIDDMVQIISPKEHRDMLRRIGLLKRDMIELRRLIEPKENIAKFIVAEHIPLISENVRIYMRDILDHLITYNEKIAHSSEALIHTHRNYLTRVQVSIAKSSRERTDVMNNISIAAFILSPLSLVSGLLGMNVPVPGGDGNPWWFVAVMILLLVLCAATWRTTRLILSPKEKKSYKRGY